MHYKVSVALRSVVIRDDLAFLMDVQVIREPVYGPHDSFFPISSDKRISVYARVKIFRDTHLGNSRFKTSYAVYRFLTVFLAMETLVQPRQAKSIRIRV